MPKSDTRRKKYKRTGRSKANSHPQEQTLRQQAREQRESGAIEDWVKLVFGAEQRVSSGCSRLAR